jgi:hypothetical protein
MGDISALAGALYFVVALILRYFLFIPINFYNHLLNSIYKTRGKTFTFFRTYKDRALRQIGIERIRKELDIAYFIKK